LGARQRVGAMGTCDGKLKLEQRTSMRPCSAFNG